MFLPLGDAPNPRGVPVVTYALLAVNVAVYAFVTLPLGVTPVDPRDPALVEYIRTVMANAGRPVPVQAVLQQISAYDLFVFEHGFRPVAPALSDLFFAMFLHGGFAHLAGNMLFLWIYGDNVEHRLGPVRYLLAYLGTGAVATLFHMIFAAGSPLPLVGASGAISGALGFYFIWFPRNQVRLLLLFPLLIQVVTVPARWLLGLYLVADNLIPFLLAQGGGGGVAHGAHIGGFLAGAGVAWLMDRRQVTAAPPDYGPSSHFQRTPAGAIRQAIAEERFGEAAEAYFALDRRESPRVLSPQDSLQMAAWLRGRGHDHAALVVYRRHLRDYPAGPGAAQAHLGAALIQLETLDQPTAAYQHLLDALDLDPSPQIAQQVRELIDQIGSRQKFRIGRPRGGPPW